MRSQTFFKAVIYLLLTVSAAMFELDSFAMHANGLNTRLSKRPNILFCIADDASMQHMSAYKKGFTAWVKTPGFDKIAQDGILFNNVYTPNAKCSPSRSAILTGRNPWQLEEAGNHSPYFPEKFVTFMEALGENGYRVGFSGKGWAPGEPGTRNGVARKLTGQAYNSLKLKAPTKYINDFDYPGNFETFLANNPTGEPFCFWFGGTEPHRAYEYGSGVAKGGKKLSDIREVPSYWPDNEQVRNDMLDYAYEVEYFDKQLLKMLAVLEKNGELDNTIVIVTSDNGMPFPRTKGHVYEYSNHLPMAVMWKNGVVSPGRSVNDYVSFIDFAPTFMEVAGVDYLKAGMQPITGKSLLNIFKNRSGGHVEKARDHVLLGRERNDVGRPNDEGYPVRGIVKDGYIYTINYEPDRWPAGNPETGYLDTDGSPTKTSILQANRNGEHKLWMLSFGKKPAEELYKISDDPYSIHNLASEKKYAGTKRKLKLQLEDQLKSEQDPRMYGKGYLFDQYRYSAPKVRGLYERKLKGEKMNTDWVEPTDYEKQAVKP